MTANPDCSTRPPTGEPLAMAQLRDEIARLREERNSWHDEALRYREERDRYRLWLYDTRAELYQTQDRLTAVLGNLGTVVPARVALAQLGAEIEAMAESIASERAEREAAAAAFVVPDWLANLPPVEQPPVNLAEVQAWEEQEAAFKRQDEAMCLSCTCYRTGNEREDCLAANRCLDERPLDNPAQRRVDREGRDVTDLPGLWDEEDLIEQVPANQAPAKPVPPVKENRPQRAARLNQRAARRIAYGGA